MEQYVNVYLLKTSNVCHSVAVCSIWSCLLKTIGIWQPVSCHNCYYDYGLVFVLKYTVIYYLKIVCFVQNILTFAQIGIMTTEESIRVHPSAYAQFG